MSPALASINYIRLTPNTRWPFPIQRCSGEGDQMHINTLNYSGELAGAARLHFCRETNAPCQTKRSLRPGKGRFSSGHQLQHTPDPPPGPGRWSPRSAEPPDRPARGSAAPPGAPPSPATALPSPATAAARQEAGREAPRPRGGGGLTGSQLQAAVPPAAPQRPLAALQDVVVLGLEQLHARTPPAGTEGGRAGGRAGRSGAPAAPAHGRGRAGRAPETRAPADRPPARGASSAGHELRFGFRPRRPHVTRPVSAPAPRALKGAAAAVGGAWGARGAGLALPPPVPQSQGRVGGNRRSGSRSPAITELWH